MSNKDPFDEADFYTCDRDEEILSLESPDEAICERHDRIYPESLKGKEVVVYAYKRRKVTDTMISGESILEDLEDDLANEYGSHCDAHEFWSKDERESIVEKLEAVINHALSTAKSWACEVVAERTYTADEVREILGVP